MNRHILLVTIVGLGLVLGCGDDGSSSSSSSNDNQEQPLPPEDPNQGTDPVDEPPVDEPTADPCADPGDLEPLGMPSLMEHDNPHDHHHDDPNEEERFDEHVALFDLVPHAAATHVAVRDGHWCNPTTWHDHELPGEGAHVVIQEGREVIYDLSSEVELVTVRVDGALIFDPDSHTQMVVDTLVVDPRGELWIGTADHPVEQGSATILFTDEGDLDIGADPMLLGRGLISHGATHIHGAEKLVHARVAADPVADDTSLEMATEPRGWQVGDTLVVAGTTYSGWKWDNDIHEVRYHGTRDEVVTITAIDGHRVEFEPPLLYDHTTPREDLKTAVANFSRTVTFANQRGTDAPVHHRAHVMFMHNQGIDVRYASFWHLGRTDKSRRADAVERLDEVAADTNIQGRYSFHFHRTGIEDYRNPGIALGNAVFGSPGWGFVHHDSHAIFHDNASFNTFGAGFVAETGNETGTWTRNIAIAAEGNRSTNPKNGVDISIFDIARTGTGFWFQGRMVRANDNVAASVNQGFAYFHRDSSGTMLPFSAHRFSFPDALGLAPEASPNHPPILHFHGNEAFASTVGLIVVKANPNQRHDVRSWMSDFLAWSVIIGAELEYTSHYTLEDFELIGQESEPFRDARTGIVFGNNTSDMVVLNSRVEGFETGLRLGKHFTDNMGGDSIPAEANTNVIVDVEIVDVDEEFEELDQEVDLLLTGDDLVADRFELHFEDDHLSYSADQHTGRSTPFALTKIDTIGPIELPAGTDSLGVNMQQMIRILERYGFFQDDQDRPLVMVREYFSDRATGEVHKELVPVWLEDDVPLQNEHFSYRDAIDRGSIDLSLAPPEVEDLHLSIAVDEEVTVDGLAGVISDSPGELEISGVFQPRHGDVFWSPDGELTYRPDFDFQGTDHFTYWVYDGQAGLTGARVTIDVD